MRLPGCSNCYYRQEKYCQSGYAQAARSAYHKPGNANVLGKTTHKEATKSTGTAGKQVNAGGVVADTCAVQPGKRLVSSGGMLLPARTVISSLYFYIKDQVNRKHERTIGVLLHQLYFFLIFFEGNLVSIYALASASVTLSISLPKPE